MLYNFIRKIYKSINAKAVSNNGVEKERMPLEQQRAFLASFAEPKDDFERSYYKYQCFFEYCYYDRKWQKVIYNIGAMIVLPFVRWKFKKKQVTPYGKPADAVIENVPRLPNADVIPEELKAKYTNVYDLTEINYGECYLDETADNICKELKHRYFWHFYFRLIVMIKMALFNSYIERYSPKAIVFYSIEREFSGPLQTYLCEQKGVRYEAFMHGDYLYSVCFAFMRFSAYYTWDEAYNRMFEELRCQFPMTTYVPEKLKGIAEKLDEHDCKYFMTYYFSDETRKCAEVVRDIFDEFRKAGLRCKLRPHPRFSDMEMLGDVFRDYEIEKPREYSLASSITETLYTVGLNTTVLSQAYFSGKTVVIDDMTMPAQYQELADKGYIMMNRPHLCLSEVLGQIRDGCPYDESYQFTVRG